MIDSLKHLYKENIIFDIDEATNPKSYAWFSDHNGNYFGINSKCMSQQELKLMELFFQSILPPVHSLSKREKFWQQMLFGESTQMNEPIQNKFQFIYFHIKQPEFEPTTFSELLRELFETDISILWQDQQNGLIVVEGEMQVSYHEIIDTITTELLVDFSLFVGSVLNDWNAGKRTVHIETELFRAARKKLPNQKLYTFEKMLPIILTDQLSQEFRSYFTDAFFKDIKGDQELLYSIKVYLESNMNLSLAAKKLFIHRNSLQYRVDKFIEKTGIDVKQFENAVTLYLSLLLK
jgi:sugar diacid utilization regulator